ncbi:MAG: hypothetical protein AB7K09_01980 [Planctomycetota bacterium]
MGGALGTGLLALVTALVVGTPAPRDNHPTGDTGTSPAPQAPTDDEIRLHDQVHDLVAADQPADVILAACSAYLERPGFVAWREDVLRIRDTQRQRVPQEYTLERMVLALDRLSAAHRTTVQAWLRNSRQRFSLKIETLDRQDLATTILLTPFARDAVTIASDRITIAWTGALALFPPANQLPHQALRVTLRAENADRPGVVEQIVWRAADLTSLAPLDVPEGPTLEFVARTPP